MLLTYISAVLPRFRGVCADDSSSLVRLSFREHPFVCDLAVAVGHPLAMTCMRKQVLIGHTLLLLLSVF